MSRTRTCTARTFYADWASWVDAVVAQGPWPEYTTWHEPLATRDWDWSR